MLAAVYTLIETCKMNDVDPQAWLADVLARLPDHPPTKSQIFFPGIGRRTVQSRRCCLSALRQTILPAWGAGRMRTEKVQPGSEHRTMLPR
jgi:hypothetical protein